jgi:LEA14-like dessication related protein
MRMRAAIAVIAAAATIAGCKTLGRQAFAEPQVNFRELRVNGLGLTGGSIDVVLSVYNPNNFRLDATRLTYKLMIDTVMFGQGTLDQNIQVQEKDSTIVRIPVNFTYLGVGQAGRSVLNTGTVPYRVMGDLTVATPLGNFTRPYDQQGRYSLMSGNSR